VYLSLRVELFPPHGGLTILLGSTSKPFFFYHPALWTEGCYRHSMRCYGHWNVMVPHPAQQIFESHLLQVYTVFHNFYKLAAIEWGMPAIMNSPCLAIDFFLPVGEKTLHSADHTPLCGCNSLCHSYLFESRVSFFSYYSPQRAVWPPLVSLGFLLLILFLRGPDVLFIMVWYGSCYMAFPSNATY
jgi:hypothetical protein